MTSNANVHTVDLTLRLDPSIRYKPYAQEYARVVSAPIKSQRVRIGFDDIDGLDESIQYIEHYYLPLRIRQRPRVTSTDNTARWYAWNIWAALDHFPATERKLRVALKAWHAENGTTPIVDVPGRMVMWFADGDERPPLGVAAYPNPTGRNASERSRTYIEPRYARGKGLAGLHTFGRVTLDPLLTSLGEALHDVTEIMLR